MTPSPSWLAGVDPSGLWWLFHHPGAPGLPGLHGTTAGGLGSHARKQDRVRDSMPSHVEAALLSPHLCRKPRCRAKCHEHPGMGTAGAQALCSPSLVWSVVVLAVGRDGRQEHVPLMLVPLLLGATGAFPVACARLLAALCCLSCLGQVRPSRQAELSSYCTWAALVLCLGLLLPRLLPGEVGNLSWLPVSCAQEFNISSPSRAVPICRRRAAAHIHYRPTGPELTMADQALGAQLPWAAESSLL